MLLYCFYQRRISESKKLKVSCSHFKYGARISAQLAIA